MDQLIDECQSCQIWKSISLDKKTGPSLDYNIETLIAIATLI